MYKLEITIGYGEHCDDMFTQSYMEINDEKALKYKNLTDEESNEMGWLELSILSHCITKELADKIVKFFNSLWKRKTGEGYEVDHIVLNDDCSRFWWIEMGCMTEEEFEWFSGIYNNYYNMLFYPKVEWNWYGVVGARIVYEDEKENMNVLNSDEDKLATEIHVDDLCVKAPSGYMIGNVTPTGNGYLVEYRKKK